MVKPLICAWRGWWDSQNQKLFHHRNYRFSGDVANEPIECKRAVLRSLFSLSTVLIHVDDSPEVLEEIRQFVDEQGNACNGRVVGISIRNKRKIPGVHFCINVREAIKISLALDDLIIFNSHSLVYPPMIRRCLVVHILSYILLVDCMLYPSCLVSLIHFKFLSYMSYAPHIQHNYHEYPVLQ